MTDFAVYRGEELLIVGTAAECAEFLKVKPDTVKYYATPTWAKRYETRKKPDKCLIAVKLNK